MMAYLPHILLALSLLLTLTTLQVWGIVRSVRHLTRRFDYLENDIDSTLFLKHDNAGGFVYTKMKRTDIYDGED